MAMQGAKVNFICLDDAGITRHRGKMPMQKPSRVVEAQSEVGPAGVQPAAQRR